MQRLEVSYDGSARCVPDARHAVEATLGTWGREDLGWTAALLVSELAANATLHARTPFTVVLLPLPDGAVRLEVRDASPRVPRQRHFGEEATTGRGLHLVEQLSRAWGVDSGPQGKTVWAELAADGGARGGQDEHDADTGDLDALLLAFPDLDEAPDDPRARAA